MSSLFLFKLVAALIILIISVIIGVVSLHKARIYREHHILELGEALAGGIFLGIALFHMLPDAEQSFHTIYGANSYPYANLLCGLGFVILLFLEKIVLSQIEHKHHLPAAKTHSTVPYVLPLVLSVHAFIEGGALGINTTIMNTLFIFIAIIAHKGSESFALATSLGRSTLSLRLVILLFTTWALMTPLGIVLGFEWTNHLQTHNGPLLAATFNAFAAGTFLYIATLHQVNHMCTNHKSAHLLEFLLMVLGLTVMALVEIWL